MTNYQSTERPGHPDTSSFSAEVYELVRQIPSGKVASYGLLARLLGYPSHARLVGRAMSLTPSGQNIPAWRVVNSQGRLAPGWTEQRQLLEAEGVVFLPSGKVSPQSVWNPYAEFGDI
ncbi:MAG: MGMT family protein [Bacteroidales bacterium]|nr:MGMT family protein [Bacteroidales bacterium]